MTCKDCIHEKVCDNLIAHGLPWEDGKYPAEKWCDHFKPTADVVEVRADYNVGDFCLYVFADGNKSLAIVEIVKILDDERGIAEVKFHKVIKDNTGNGFFHYLFKNGKTMNASFAYLKNITPKVDGERREE